MMNAKNSSRNFLTVRQQKQFKKVRPIIEEGEYCATIKGVFDRDAYALLLLNPFKVTEQGRIDYSNVWLQLQYDYEDNSVTAEFIDNFGDNLDMLKGEVIGIYIVLNETGEKTYANVSEVFPVNDCTNSTDMNTIEID